MKAKKSTFAFTGLIDTMRSIISVFLILLFATHAFSQQVSSQNTASVQSELASNFAVGPHIEVSLLNEQDSIVAGSTIHLGVLFRPDPQWHTYWLNPGDSGEAPTIKWQSNYDLSFKDINWPLPVGIPVAHLVNYGYEAENLLIVEVSIPEDLSPTQSLQSASIENTVVVQADVSWLVCKEDCIPGWATLTLSLPISNEANLSEHADLFKNTRQMWPSNEQKTGLFEVTDSAIVFEVNDVQPDEWKVFPFRSDLINHAAAQSVISDGTTTRIVVPRSDYFYGEASELKWLISNGEQGYYVQGTASASAPSNAANSEPASLASLAIFALMAFVGGLILNVMPCVLPILSIKAMALQNSQQSITHKLAYLGGVLFCFNLFALIIVLLQQSGQQVGWGFHMQEPVVVVLLAFLFTWIALVLLDAMAVNSNLANIGQGLVNGESAGAHFATGTLAVIVASPCTAPFMAAALGVALVSEPYVTVVLFNALAVGFALPLTLLFVSKRAKNWLPKPGAWMETFKRVLAFPMFATVAWLCWVFAGQKGAQLQFVLLSALILFCMFIYLLGQSKAPITKAFNSIAALLCFLLPVWVSTSSHLGSIEQDGQSDTLSYIEFNKDTLTRLINEEEVVVVNMTADWCITCKVNEQVAFSSDEVKTALAQEGVTYMLGDWTNKNNEILQYLNEYQRAGVPLYVVYAGSKSKQILPQILSPSAVISAINQAKEEVSNVN
ncbi:thioredoxin family protein [Glaciecola siphonariae]|uniref:Thioredoxin family protein n=1 Tax=Glaciecola siphonariae TaxID=521012 RepID=A0ABV9LVX1_9ALTE